MTEHIILGAIPLKNQSHDQLIKQEGVSLVLTLLEDFEITHQGIFTSPVCPKDWEALQIEQKHIKAQDFLPLSLDHMHQGADILKSAVENQQKVYVHCKAGRGRSATIVICYLLKYCGYKLDEAISFVKEKRPQINLNAQQMQAIQSFSEQLNQASSMNF